ncbi:MAG TPA: hypothetical protein DCZ94_07280 [Lentisphaeria bacterium]|nr:MAG: hypothetical protein A2X48_20430 [Lentisphaerae bacterium GWF2_49_21]HBC86738.1 hypothetical protein [Lentisphaeria bacterium]
MYIFISQSKEINAKNAKNGLLFLGSAFCLSCLFFFKRTYILASSHDWGGAVIMAMVGLYCLYIGYLNWFNFSTSSIRHVCGFSLTCVFFIVDFYIIKVLTQNENIRNILMVLLIAGLIWLYIIITKKLTSLLFDENATRPKG